MDLFALLIGKQALIGGRAMRRFFEFIKDQRGASAVEYGLILAMIFLAMIAGVSRFAGTTQDMWNHVSNEVRGN